MPDPNRSGLFEYLNAGKYGTTVDLEADASAASRLIADAHVLVEALGPGMLDRLGLGVRVLEALRPGLVVVRISDFGHRGPLRDRVAVFGGCVFLAAQVTNVAIRLTSRVQSR